MLYLITPLAAYLLGSVSSAILISRLLGLPDPRTEGSRNPGATNVLRLGSKPGAVLTLAGDIAKGVLPVAEHHDVQKHLSKPASQPLEKFSFPQKLPEMPPPEMLLSEGAAVTTSVRGNLGPASTITDSKNADWYEISTEI